MIATLLASDNNSKVFESPAEKDIFGQQELNINSKEYWSVKSEILDDYADSYLVA